MKRSKRILKQCHSLEHQYEGLEDAVDRLDQQILHLRQMFVDLITGQKPQSEVVKLPEGRRPAGARCDESSEG